MTLDDSIKSFDFYKTLPDKVAEKTLYGALISCLMIFCICFSVIKEINDYYTPRIISEMYVENMAKNHDLKFFLNVSLPFIPCSLSPLIAGTTIDNSDRLITSETNFTRTNKQGNDIGRYFTQNETQTKREYPIQLQNEEGCRIEANLILLRVPGQISLCDFFYNFTTIKVPSLVYTHTINEFRAGETVSPSIFPTLMPMKTHSNSIKNYKYNNPKNNLHINYLIEIVRIVYTDEQEKNHVSDELRYRLAFEEYPEGYMQGIYFAYSVSPVYIQYMIQRKSLLKLIMRLIIVIGGTYTVFGILDSIIHFIALKLTKKTYKEIF